MSTTPSQALQAARAYVAATMPGVRVTGLMQDATDYLACLEQDAPWPGGGEAVWVSKATGQVWTDNLAARFAKYDAMTKVQL